MALTAPKGPLGGPAERMVLGYDVEGCSVIDGSGGRHRVGAPAPGLADHRA